MNSIGIGLLGCGTVGGGVVDILSKRGPLLTARSGLSFTLEKVLDTQVERVLALGVEASRITAQASEVIQDPAVQVVIELIGGIEPARTFVLDALRAGKAVVTANKKLLAECGDELYAAAEAAGVPLLAEASVAGGIPLLSPLRDGLVVNQVDSVCGILNGTCNYLLTAMEARGSELSPILVEAQAQGIAERDPSLDIDGWDTAHKVCVLARLAFGTSVALDRLPVKGVRDLYLADITLAARFGFRIKLLGVLQRRGEQLMGAVHPVLLPQEAQLSGVEGANNMVIIDADQTGPTGYYGPGAGRFPTASAVLADVVEAGHRLQTPGHLRTNQPPAEPLAFMPEDFRSAGRWLVRCSGDRGAGWETAQGPQGIVSARLFTADSAADALEQAGLCAQTDGVLTLPAPEGLGA